MNISMVKMSIQHNFWSFKNNFFSRNGKIQNEIQGVPTSPSETEITQTQIFVQNYQR